VLSLVTIGVQQGCTPEPDQVRVIPNEPPETVASGAPLDSSSVFHRYHMFWAGFDPDGTVDRYFVAVADSNVVPTLPRYRATSRTDSIIVFTANNEVVLSHTFWVYAVDNEGARDQTPARVYFNAVDRNRPVPVITEARKTIDGIETALALNDTLPSSGASVTICWTATDPDVGGSITAYRIKLSNESRFAEVPADQECVTYSGLPSGEYEFLVEAVDNAGAESLDPASFTWIVNREPDTRITQMFISNRDGFFEVTDFRNNPPQVRDSTRVLLFFEGNDADGEVVAFTTRVFRTDIERGSVRRFPFSTAFTENFVSHPIGSVADTSQTSQLRFFSNDYDLLVRSRDNEGKNDGTPDQVSLSVNFTPQFDLPALEPQDGAVLAYPADPATTPLVVKFRATDVESETTSLEYRAIIDGQLFGRVISNVPETQLQDQFLPFPEPGTHTIEFRVEDPGRRSAVRTHTFTIQ